MNSNGINNKLIARNVFYSVLAQAISLITSFILSLIVPKFISEYEYAYWQTYVLYVSYVGILHFGLLDGFVLRYSQYDFNTLDKKAVRSQFQVLFIYLLLISIATVICGYSLFSDEYQKVIVMIGIGIFIKNFLTYTTYTFQMTNRISNYALLIIVDRTLYAIGIVVLLCCHIEDFVMYCLIDLGSDFIAALVAAKWNKGLYLGSIISKIDLQHELWLSLSAGFFIMIANFTNNLIIGSAKMIIQWYWSVLQFGKIAFSFSLSAVFLTFIQAISIVLFPSLKRVDINALPSLYGKIRSIIVPLLIVILIFYFPGCHILKIWLPQYTSSLSYLGILLPIIIFLSKTSLLTNNYLKTYRREKTLFRINIVSLVLGLILFFCFALLFKNLEMLLYSIVFVIIIQSVLSELIVSKIIKTNLYRDILVEICYSVLFILCSKFSSLWEGFLCYGACLIPFIAIQWKKYSQNREQFNK